MHPDAEVVELPRYTDLRPMCRDGCLLESEETLKTHVCRRDDIKIGTVFVPKVRAAAYVAKARDLWRAGNGVIDLGRSTPAIAVVARPPTQRLFVALKFSQHVRPGKAKEHAVELACVGAVASCTRPQNASLWPPHVLYGGLYSDGAPFRVVSTEVAGFHLGDMIFGIHVSVIAGVFKSPCAQKRWPWLHAGPGTDYSLTLDPLADSVQSVQPVVFGAKLMVNTEPACVAEGGTAVRCGFCRRVFRTRLEWQDECAPDLEHN